MRTSPVAPASMGVSVQLAAVQPQEVRTVCNTIGPLLVFLNLKICSTGRSRRILPKSCSLGVSHSTTFSGGAAFATLAPVDREQANKKHCKIVENIDDSFFIYLKPPSIVQANVCNQLNKPLSITKSSESWYVSKVRVEHSDENFATFVVLPVSNALFAQKCIISKQKLPFNEISPCFHVAGRHFRSWPARLSF